jgi:RHS repeat-associated protein
MVALTALLFATQAYAYAPGYWDSPYANPSFDPKHAMDVGPGDSIDLFSGAVNLAVTDARVPGSFGLDMVVTRGYSSKVVDENLAPIDTGWAGLGWTLVPGGRIFFDWWLDALYGGTYFIRVDLPGLGQQVAFLLDPADPIYRDAADANAFPGMDAGYTSVYVTESFTFVYQTGGSEYKAITTDGLVYSFDLSSGTQVDSWYYGDSVENEHGDRINFHYDDCAYTTRGGALESMIDAGGRGIYFGVNPSCFLKSTTTMSTPGPAITVYLIDGSGLLRTIYSPAGETTNYTYNGTYNELTSVDLPMGGWVEYTYDTVSVLADYDTVWGEAVLEIQAVGTRTLYQNASTSWTWEYEFDDYYAGHSTFGVITADSDYRVTRVNQPGGGVIDHYYGSFCYTEIGGKVRSACTSDWIGLSLQTVWYESSASSTPTKWVYTDWTDSGASSYSMNRVLLSSAVAYNPYQNWDYGASKPVPTYVLEYEDRAVGSSEYKLWTWYGETSAGAYDQYGNLASSYDVIAQPYFSTSSSARYYGLETQSTWAWSSEPALDGWNLIRLPSERSVGQGDGTGTLASTRDETITTYSTTAGRLGWVSRVEQLAQGQADYDGDSVTDNNPSADEYVSYSYSFTGSDSFEVEADFGGERTLRTSYSRGTQLETAWANGTTWDIDNSASVHASSGLVTDSTDASGNTTKYRYDLQGRLTRVTPPVGTVRWIDYSLSASPATITQTIGASESIFTYDGLGRLASVQTDNGTGAVAVVEQEHDGFDRITKDYMPHSGTSAGWIKRTTDVLGRVTRLSQDDGSGVTLDTYTDYSWPTVDQTDAVGETTSTTVDSYGQAALVSPPEGVTLEALGVGSSAVTGQLVDVVDFVDGTVLQQITYTDQSGRPWYFTDWQSGGRVFQRNAAGDVVCEWDDNGDHTVTRFDTQGRPEALTYGSSCAPVAVPDVAWTYDGDSVSGVTGFAYANAEGRVNAVQDEAGTQEFSYDVGGRVVATRRTGSDLASGFEASLDRDFDGEGNLDDQTLSFDGETWQILSTYGPGNRVERIRIVFTDGDGASTVASILDDATYHPNGVPKTLTYANGVVETLTADAYGRPERVYTTGATQDMDLVYTFDANGRVETLTDADGSDVYTVDKLGRLTAVAYGDDTTSVSYVYDDSGNMTERSGDYSGTFSGLNYSANHRTDWSWDAVGNLTHDGTSSFIWTPSGQLRSSNDGNVVLLAGYDAGGRRVVQSEISPSGSIERQFELYDPQGLLVARFVSLGGGWHLKELYVHAAGRPIAVLSRGSTDEMRFLHQDVSGSTRMLTNRGGATVGTREFLPFGGERQAAGMITGTAFSFAGHEEFNDLGTADFGLRPFHEQLPRFMSPDRVALGSPSDPQSFNRYSYGANNPVSFVDPGGDFAVPLLIFGALKAYDIASTAYDVYKVSTGEKSLGSFVAEAAVGLVVGKAVAGVALAGAGAALVAGRAIAKRMARKGGGKGTSALASKGAGKLTSLGDGRWQSKEGLIYGQSKKDGNRVKHVLEHAKPNPSKAKHSVFNVDRNGVLGLVDEAWGMRGSGIIQGNSNTLYKIDMGRQVGTAGENSLIIVIRKGTTSDLITAFPTFSL